MVDVCERIFWAKNFLLRRSAITEFNNALKSESLSSEELRLLSWRKRKKLVHFAFHNCRFYNDYYKSQGFDPNNLKTESDWGQVPVLERSHIKSRSADLLSKDVSKRHLISVTTGGSTGIPLRTYRDSRFPEEILKWRMLRRWSRSPAEHQLMLWRIPSPMQTRSRQLVNSVLWFPTKRLKIDASALDRPSILQAIEFVLKYRPGIIWGYVGAIDQFADFVLQEGVTFPHEPLVWVTAAPVTDIQRRKFATAFGRNILDQYACSEIHWVASSLPDEESLLVDSDYRHLEVVNDDGVSCNVEQYGDILITDLSNFAFPLIRYRVGDRTALRSTQNADSPAFSLIAPVKGRTSESIKSPVGRSLTGEYVTTIFDEHVDLIRQFRVHQHNDYSVDVYVVPSGIENESLIVALRTVTDLLSQKLGGTVMVRGKVVKELPHEGGKLRFIKSDLI